MFKIQDILYFRYCYLWIYDVQTNFKCQILNIKIFSKNEAIKPNRMLKQSLTMLNWFTGMRINQHKATRLLLSISTSTISL